MKWEYLKEYDLSDEQLNEFGKNGWNLVNFTFIQSEYTDNFYYYIFKRQLLSTQPSQE